MAPAGCVGTPGLPSQPWASQHGCRRRPRSVFTPRPLPAALYKGTPQSLTAGSKPAGPSAACGNSPSPFSARIIFVFFDTQPSYGYRKEIGWFSKPKFFFCSSGLQKKKKKISRCCRSGCQVISAGGVRLIFSFICCTLPRFHQRKWPLCHRAKISKLVLLLQQILSPATWGTWGWEAGGHRRRPSSVAEERRGRGRAS